MPWWKPTFKKLSHFMGCRPSFVPIICRIYVFVCSFILAAQFSLGTASSSSSFSSFFSFLENFDQNPFFSLMGSRAGPFRRDLTFAFSARPSERTYDLADWARWGSGSGREVVEAWTGSWDVKVVVDAFRELSRFNPVEGPGSGRFDEEAFFFFFLLGEATLSGDREGSCVAGV